MEQHEVNPDRIAEREVLELKVICNLDEEGCTWRGELRELEKHRSECKFVTVPCELSCRANVMRRDMRKHVEKICPRRRVPCQYCKESFQACGIKTHFSSCPQFPIPCPLDCQETIARCEIERHVAADGTCPNTKIKCSYAGIGCTFDGKRNDMDRHKKEELHHHLDLSLTKINEMTSEIEDLKKKKACCSKEGTDFVYLWKINDWEAKLNEANTKTGYSFSSDPVYISEPGHRVALVMCPNEKMTGYVGIYLKVIKGNYDEIITWPFRRDYSVILIDQQRKRKDITRDIIVSTDQEIKTFFFHPDDTSAYGFKEFISHNDLGQRQYVKNDSLLVKLVVYTSRDGEET